MLWLFRHETVIEGGHHHVMSNESAVANGNAALILKAAAGVYEDVPANSHVLAAVGVERREHAK